MNKVTAKQTAKTSFDSNNVMPSFAFLKRSAIIMPLSLYNILESFSSDYKLSQFSIPLSHAVSDLPKKSEQLKSLLMAVRRVSYSSHCCVFSSSSEEATTKTFNIRYSISNSWFSKSISQSLCLLKKTYDSLTTYSCVFSRNLMSVFRIFLIQSSPLSVIS